MLGGRGWACAGCWASLGGALGLHEKQQHVAPLRTSLVSMAFKLVRSN